MLSESKIEKNKINTTNNNDNLNQKNIIDDKLEKRDSPKEIINFTRKKFHFKSQFDRKGSEKFLDAKDIALGEVILNDEIVEEEKKEKKKQRKKKTKFKTTLVNKQQFLELQNNLNKSSKNNNNNAYTSGKSVKRLNKKQSKSQQRKKFNMTEIHMTPKNEQNVLSINLLNMLSDQLQKIKYNNEPV